MAKKDRTIWMESLLADGSWKQNRRLRKPKTSHRGKLRNRQGQLVDSDEWADTMAEHLEMLQWCVRPVCLTVEYILGEKLPADSSDLSYAEVRKVLVKLRRNRAAGPDQIPAGYLRALADDPTSLSYLTAL